VSSESGVAPYAFAQLDAPPTVGEIADALAAVHREADQIRERARAQGHAEGYAAGLAEAREQSTPALSALRDLGGEFEALRERVIAELEQDALAMAFELCEHIMAGAVSVKPERVLDVARHALRHLSDRRQVTLVVNPDDLALLNDAAVGLQAELGGIEHLAVQADRRVGRGGALARTEAGEIDSSLAAQLARARELVAEDLAETLPDAPSLLRPVSAAGAVDDGPEV
jgi:flagellar biosynthesis/type III secretory pathway protein FliH